MKKKLVLVRVLGICAALALALGIQWGVWQQYQSPTIVGTVIKDNSSDLESITLEWFKSYTDELTGLNVPFEFRIHAVGIDSSELLQDNFVQLNYHFSTFKKNPQLPEDFDYYQTEPQSQTYYEGQMVIQWQKSLGGWQILDTMRPAEYQIRFSPEIQAEREQPETIHYKMTTYNSTPYYVKDETLYVTYDSGTTYLEVPDGYETICKNNNGSYSELLPMNSYVITPEFTAFLIYKEVGSLGYDSATYLLYSTDAGTTWEESLVYPGGYKANSFVSQTENGCYVTFAVDRALGSDYYATYYSQDLETWEAIDTPAHDRNYTCVFWPEDGVGYYSGGTITFISTAEDGTTTEETLSNVFYRTTDNGKTYDSLQFQEAQEVLDDLGFFPFDTLEAMYQEDGILYMVVGQGDDGDYTQDGKMIQAMYQSEDGENFTFVETFTEHTVLAG